MAQKKTAKQQNNGLTYKGKPLIRKGDMLYYGDSSKKYIITMKVLDKEKVKDLEVAKKISIELQINDPSLKAKKRIVKKAERDGLYSALDIGVIWLEDAVE